MAFTYTTERRQELEAEPFNIDDCQITIEFTFDKNGDECFPRNENTSAYLDLAIFNTPNTTFQNFILSMKFDSVDFTWFTSPNTPKVFLNKFISWFLNYLKFFLCFSRI